jgi:hypothetical protein
MVQNMFYALVWARIVDQYNLRNYSSALKLFEKYYSKLSGRSDRLAFYAMILIAVEKSQNAKIIFEEIIKIDDSQKYKDQNVYNYILNYSNFYLSIINEDGNDTSYYNAARKLSEDYRSNIIDNLPLPEKWN